MVSIEKMLKDELDRNNQKLTLDFIEEVARQSKVIYLHPTPSMRLCILTLPTGHEILGKAQVLNPINDVEKYGNDVAYKDAVQQIWGVMGTLAKVIIND